MRDPASILRPNIEAPPIEEQARLNTEDASSSLLGIARRLMVRAETEASILGQLIDVRPEYILKAALAILLERVAVNLEDQPEVQQVLIRRLAAQAIHMLSPE